MRIKLAIVTTHPIQYYAPWFRWIPVNSSIELKVFYLWDRESSANRDPGFGRAVAWDLPLLEGYECEFVPNSSSRPGSDRFWGIRNDEVGSRIRSWKCDAALLIGYRYATMMKLILTPERARGFPLIFRGDSHRLATSRSRNSEVRTRTSLSGPMTSRLRELGIAAIYRRFAAVTYVGKANKEYFRMLGVAEEKLFFAPHCVDNDRFFAAAEMAKEEAKSWRRQLGIPEDHLVVLFAGKFEEKKRPLQLLEAFEQLQRRGQNSEVRGPLEQGPDFRHPISDIGARTSLLFVGSGMLEAELKRRASTIPDVYFAPFQNQTAMPRTYAACDLFVLPSYGPEESWGLAVNEAMCMGKAVIVSSHVGCGPDLVHPGINGLIFEAGNVDALAQALAEALSDRDRLKRWGEAGRDIVRDYDYKHATAGLEQALGAVSRKVEGGR